MPATPHVLFAGGGAPGHIHPGIAVADHLRDAESKVRISFAGPGNAREKQLVRSAGHKYVKIPSQPIPQNPFQAFRFVTDNVAGYCAARWLIGEQKVSLVVGLGGLTTPAVIRAAVSRGVPFLLLEQNALPSKTTRWFAKDAVLTCAAFEEVRPHLDVQSRVSITGSPARPAFEKLYERTSRDRSDVLAMEKRYGPQPKRLVVIGGAGGARSLNESMPTALKQVRDSLGDWQIIHQTGEGQLQETARRYQAHGVDALTVTFIDEIASVLFASDLIVCRAGGTTLAELALAGLPAILVPYPHASDDHQLANSRIIAAGGACRLVNESSLGRSLDKVLATELSGLLVDDESRRHMSHQMGQLARPEASAEIAESIQNVLFGNRRGRMAA